MKADVSLHVGHWDVVLSHGLQGCTIPDVTSQTVFACSIQ